MQLLPVDLDYITDLLVRLLGIPSPTGYTDQVVHATGEELKRLGLPFELTRRGAIRANLEGKQRSPDRALVAHLDTLGAMVHTLKPNGRLAIVPIGTWSSRFAEGARVTILSDAGPHRGTILPLKASGHAFDDEVDSQPVSWDQVEVRVDERCASTAELEACGIAVGDFIAVDSVPEVTPTGYITARHLDDKAGVAVLLGATKAVLEADLTLPVDCHLLFTIAEEVGVGGSAVLHGDVAEMVTIDNAVCAPNQNSSEHGVTIAVKDAAGPFDYHLTQKLLRLCADHGLEHRRDVFRHYRSDSASAVEAGNDIRTALACFGLDATHGYERTHRDSLRALAQLITLYIQSPPTFTRDRAPLAPLEGFPTQPT